MAEDLRGMTAEQLMLRDLIYELHDELAEAASEDLPGYRLGVRRIAALLQQKLDASEIDQSKFARQMPDVDAWYLGQAR
jgi:hypothetical protein